MRSIERIRIEVLGDRESYAGCGGSYPGSDGRSEAQRHACEVGCDMGYSVCTIWGGGGSSGGVIAR